MSSKVIFAGHYSKYCIIVHFTMLSAYCTIAQQPCPAALPGSLAWQYCPAALPGSLPGRHAALQKY
jgi:hypothetical protein